MAQSFGIEWEWRLVCGKKGDIECRAVGKRIKRALYVLLYLAEGI